MEEEQRKKKFKECTFKPKINESSLPTRNLDEFLENQNAHLLKVQKKKD